MNIIQECNDLKEQIDLLRSFSAEDENRIIQKFRLDWNYHSNHIEGNSLTYGETKALILFGITAQGKPLKDHIEVTGHNEAIELILEVIDDERPISENFIREIHTLILKKDYYVNAITPSGGPTKKLVKVGSYKVTPNHVRTETGEIFRFAEPEETAAMMSELMKWLHSRLNEKPNELILIASEFHYRFIRIHPFDDGNGRAARILMNLILMRGGYPPVIIKYENRHEYFAALRQADAGMIDPFISFIAGNLITSLQIMLKGAKGLKIEEEDEDIDKEIKMFKQEIYATAPQYQLTKTKEALLSIYDKSIEPLARKFAAKSRFLDELYLNSRFSVSVNKAKHSYNPDVDVIGQNRDLIRAGTSSIKLNYEYKNFNGNDIAEFNYTSMIIFKFSMTRYSVSNKKDLILSKPLNLQLTKMEILGLVKSEINNHKDIIRGMLS